MLSECKKYHLAPSYCLKGVSLQQWAPKGCNIFCYPRVKCKASVSLTSLTCPLPPVLNLQLFWVVYKRVRYSSNPAPLADGKPSESAQYRVSNLHNSCGPVYCLKYGKDTELNSFIAIITNKKRVLNCIIRIELNVDWILNRLKPSCYKKIYLPIPSD